LFAPAFREYALFIWKPIVFKKIANNAVEKMEEGWKYSQIKGSQQIMEHNHLSQITLW